MGVKHNAKYIVTLTSEERKELLELVRKGKAAAYTIKHAHILLASDEHGENLPAAAVAKAYHCHAKTVYNLRQRFVEQGFSAAIHRKKYATPGPRKMDGRTEARLARSRSGASVCVGVADAALVRDERRVCRFRPQMRQLSSCRRDLDYLVAVE